MAPPKDARKQALGRLGMNDDWVESVTKDTKTFGLGFMQDVAYNLSKEVVAMEDSDEKRAVLDQLQGIIDDIDHQKGVSGRDLGIERKGLEIHVSLPQGTRHESAQHQPTEET